MSGFIEIIDKNKNRRLLNIRHIEEVAEKITKDGCYIYLAFNTPNAIEQDYFEVAESYNSVIEKNCRSHNFKCLCTGSRGLLNYDR